MFFKKTKFIYCFFKLKQKKIISLVLIIAALSIFFVNSYAHVYLKYRLKGGIGTSSKPIYYWVSSSASEYSGNAMTARDAWYTSTDLWMNKTTTKSKSVMDIYASGFASKSSGILGKTEHYNWGYIVMDKYDVSPDEMPWEWGEITFNTTVLSSYNAFVKTHTASHEMGHVFCFDENNGEPSSIMCQYGYSDKSTCRPVYADKVALNAAY